MKTKITKLKNARKEKKDEFYTQYIDIEKELKYHKEQFRNKVVYCNCDDPFESNFFKYFVSNFNALGLKKLITTNFVKSIDGRLPLIDSESQKSLDKKPFKTEINEVPKLYEDINYLLKHDKNTMTPLRGDGDFRSDECIKLLEESDIIVTNPPFSLFREYVSQLVEHKKKFLIIGNINAVSYKNIFKIIKDNKMWLGASIHGGDREFRIPDDYYSTGSRIDDDGNKYVRISGVRWFTNLDYREQHEDIILYKKYNPQDYPNYDNYDAINVDKTVDIPVDYNGIMGVPITFLDKYNPDQFEIIGMGNGGFNPNKVYKNTYMITADGTKKVENIINRVLIIESENKPNGSFYISDDSKYLIAPYVRILIRNKRLNE